jgi:cysteine synthase B
MTHRPAVAALHEELAVRRARALVVDSVLDLIGDTPLLRLRHLELPGVELWAKCEFANPGGSVKDARRCT